MASLQQAPRAPRWCCPCTPGGNESRNAGGGNFGRIALPLFLSFPRQPHYSHDCLYCGCAPSSPLITCAWTAVNAATLALKEAALVAVCDPLIMKDSGGLSTFAPSSPHFFWSRIALHRRQLCGNGESPGDGKRVTSGRV